MITFFWIVCTIALVVIAIGIYDIARVLRGYLRTLCGIMSLIAHYGHKVPEKEIMKVMDLAKDEE